MAGKKEQAAIRSYLFDIGKIVDGALASDPDKVRAYAERLRDRLTEDGEREASRRIDEMLRRREARTLTFARASGTNSPVPVDSESRLPVADVELVDDPGHAAVLAQDVRESIEQFVGYVKAADELTARGVGISASMLLYGPPGCGKTMLARYIAHALRLPLITARTDSLISSYLGSTAKNLRLLFEHAMAQPCVLFLDEFDALGKMRDDSRELGELKRVVISLLQNIDAMGPDHVLLAATNHDHLLDRAIWRRFSFKLYLDLPSLDDRRQMISQFLGDFGEPDTPDVLAQITGELSGAELRELSNNAIRAAILCGEDSIAESAFLEEATRCRPNAESWTSLSTAEKVARLAEKSNNGLTQNQIGRLVGVTQSRVSKVLSTGTHDAE